MLNRVDPELLPPLQDFMEFVGGALSLRDIPAARTQVAAMFEAQSALAPEITGVSTSDHQVSGIDGAPDLLLRVYAPVDAANTLPGLLWIHGGGYVMGSVAQDDYQCRTLVKNSGCVVASVEYRLAPETPYPGSLNDCYAGLLWFAEHSEQFAVDRDRIAIGGISAGGGLAACLGLKARDRGEVQVAYQLLLCPMLDDTNLRQASATLPDTLLWTRENNLIGWRSLLGHEPGGKDVPMYAAASRASDLSGLPPTFIGVGDIDLFAEENIDYALRLIASDVATELHVYPGGYHAFEGFAPMSALAQQYNRDRDAALCRALRREALV
ncbi:MAG: acetyl esterase/lipase [Gammaproteobacteria bacterium]|jgi:acetyl esterase/lipase